MKFANKNYAVAEDERVSKILASSEVIDASDWLKLYPKGPFSSHTLDPDDPNGTPLAPVVARLKNAGAERLVVHHGDRTFFLGLIVVLPARKRLFEIEHELSQICNQQVQKDYGQKFLYYSE